MSELREEVELIREVFTYANQFDGKTFVIKIDYPIVYEPHFPLFLKDIALLHQSGIRIVLVPGSRERIDEVLVNYGFQPGWVGGYRVASAEMIPFIKMAAFDVINHYMTVLSSFKVPAVAGNWVRARAVGVVDGVDHAHAGRVDKILVDLLYAVIEDGYIPILPCIGWSVAGKPYSIQSNELALEVSRALRAEKLFFISNFSSLYSPPYQVASTLGISPEGRIARLSLGQTQEFLQLNRDLEGEEILLQKQSLELGLQACRSGVGRAHIVDGRIEGAILKEIFSNLGIGTMVYTNQYDSIRDMRIDDIPEVMKIMKPFVDQGVLIQRSFEDIEGTYTNFIVYVVDDVVYACGALVEFNDEGQAEIAALATDPAMNELGMGKSIVHYLVDRARIRRFKRVFVLTTQTLDWFESLGFKETKLDTLPSAKQASYNHKRNSRIFALELAP